MVLFMVGTINTYYVDVLIIWIKGDKRDNNCLAGLYKAQRSGEQAVWWHIKLNR